MSPDFEIILAADRLSAKIQCAISTNVLLVQIISLIVILCFKKGNVFNKPEDIQ
jgi:hypothetical protein